MSPIQIGDRAIGPGDDVYVIAEAGVNHNGEIDLARDLVDAAAEAGADAVKFQTFDPDRLVTDEAPKADYQEAHAGGENQREMLAALELTPEMHRDLVDYAREQGIAFLSTPFDPVSADLLDDLGVPAYKIGSGDLTDHPLLAHVATKDEPVVLSTGMATLDDVRGAVEVLRENGCEALVLLHCVSAYPTDPSDANLRAMGTLREAFDVPVGFSDHTEGLTVPIAAAARGASVIEKHFTLDRSLEGPDHALSLEPDELAQMVEAVRTVERALGSGEKSPVEAERETAEVARKSLVARQAIEPGQTLTEDELQAKRPGTGIPPSAIDDVVGRRARQAIEEDDVLQREMLE